jgi:hypothetical protein
LETIVVISSAVNITRARENLDNIHLLAAFYLYGRTIALSLKLISAQSSGKLGGKKAALVAD